MNSQIEWGVQNGPTTKNGVLPTFRKTCFCLRTSYKELIWCNNHPNVHIYTFRKHWSFIWGCFFPVSILKQTNSLLLGYISTASYSFRMTPVKLFSITGQRLERPVGCHLGDLFHVFFWYKTINQSINQSIYFKERFKLYNLQIDIDIFYFYMIYLW